MVPDSTQPGGNAPDQVQEPGPRLQEGVSQASGGDHSGNDLEGFARQLAEEQANVVGAPGREPTLLQEISAYQTSLLQAYQFFRGASEQEIALSYAAEWVLDNFYIARQALHQIQEDLPGHYYRQLPKLVSGELAGYPRVYALAVEIIRYQKAHLDIDQIQAFVQAYQTITSLTMGELWALPIMLRLGTIQSLVLAVGRITRLFSSGKRLPPFGVIDLAPALSDDEVVANSFVSLRTLSAQDWKKFFENISLVELLLRRDPARLYEGMDFETRDRYRKVIEKIYLHSSHNELEIAREVLRLAQENLDRQSKPDGQTSRTSAEKTLIRSRSWDNFQAPRNAHVGYFLLGPGCPQLESLLGYQPPLKKKIKRWVFEHASLAYIGSIVFLAAIFDLLVIALAIGARGNFLQWIGAGLLGVVPGLTIAVSLVNWVVTNSFRPRVLPKMDFEAGLPEGCDTLVVIPAMLTNPKEVRSLLQQLELHYLRNLDARLLFGLVTDFGDAPQETLPEDEALLEQADAGIRALNEKYARLASESQDSPTAGGPFFLLHRRRQWNPAEGVWMGWERKRGKLHELNQFIERREQPSFLRVVGAFHQLNKVRYVITLDADTVLPRESARRLVATLAHPLNRALFNPGGEVEAGYTILQPRTEISPVSANRSFFTRLFAGDTGLDLYTLAVSDVYQDLFGEGIYVGKGIYDIRAFERSLSGKVPDNTLLSHDLFEGIQGRVGLASDLVLIEDYPPNYLVHVRRLQRWVRGDWQLLPWLFPRVPGAEGRRVHNTLSAVDRWKILDNLRRSLLAPVLLFLFISGWTWLPGNPGVWMAAGLVSLAAPFFVGLINPFVSMALAILGVAHVDSGFSGESWLLEVRIAGGELLRALGTSALHWLLALTFLPYEALITLKAILVTLGRLFITRRNLLRWTTAAQAAQRLGKRLDMLQAWQQMAAALVLGLAVAILVFFSRPTALPIAAPLLLLWGLSPEIAYWISRPLRLKAQVPEPEQEIELRVLARKTWLFFERFLGPEDHWLPPDHYQESPLGAVAHRTSPTNIGLSLLATLGAFDLGYIGLLDLGARLQSTFENMGHLDRYRGHFLNWYDTRTLEPLTPRYVSTVDSGNLAASLIALGQGCQELTHARPLRWETWQGILDSLALLLELLQELEPIEAQTAESSLSTLIERTQARILSVRNKPQDWGALLLDLPGPVWQTLDGQLVAFLEARSDTLGPENLRRLRLYTRRLRYLLDAAVREVDLLVPWFLAFLQASWRLSVQVPAPVETAWQALEAALPQDVELGKITQVVKDGQARLQDLQNLLQETSPSTMDIQAALEWCADFAPRLESALMAAKVLMIGNQELYRQANEWIQQMDFRFLFEEQRQVFHIGYNLAVGHLDNNFYDLLASEARIASLVAIAKHDVSESHWLHLGRPLTMVEGLRALLSWSATMFEYLMPALLLRSFPGTLLHQSSEAMVLSQIAYAAQKKVPWGISESGYYRFDPNLVYQYRAFGVPGLGYKRGLAEDLVISPYSSLLALPLFPQAVLQNLQAMKKIHMLGTFGLYEAVDFTPSRLSLGKPYEIVKEYMAHHQGMIFLSLVNQLAGNPLVRRFHADPRIRAVELLLQEQIPQHAPLETPHAANITGAVPPVAQVVSQPWRVRVVSPQPNVHFLSNGRFGTLICSSGSGFSRWKEVDLTRWRADTTLNDWGTWIYVQDRESGELWSAGYLPTTAPPASRDVYFNAHMVEFRRRDHEISLTMEITIPPDDDIEIRRVTLTNHSDRPRRLNLTSYGEVVLAAQATDSRHPAFNKLFIESEWALEATSLVFHRRPRSEDEPPLFLAHSRVVEGGRAPAPRFEGDRAIFLGRGQTAHRPQALLQGRTLSGTVGATLDPVFALQQPVDLAPHASIQVAFLTLAGDSRAAVTSMAIRYQAWHLIERAFERARSQAELELRQLGLTSSSLARLDQLLSALLYPHPGLRAGPEVLAENQKGQPGLWAYSISGDYPILLVQVHSPEETSLVHELLQAHIYWRNRGLLVDLVILNEQGTTYGQELTGQIHRLVARTNSDGWLNRRGGIFVLHADQLTGADRTLLKTVARVVLDSDRGSLAEQLQTGIHLPTRLPPFFPSLSEAEIHEATPELPRPTGLLFENGWGGFSPDGKEYQIYLTPGQWTPTPWINVIATPEYGFLVSEAGSGYSWSLNSGENRLTPWFNDPVSDPPGEALYLRDEETAEVWSPTPLPARAPAPYLVRHGAGYTIFEHHSHGLKQRLRLFAAPDAPLKIIQLRLENTWPRVRRVTATYYADWVLGVSRENSQAYVVPEFEGESQALLARNSYNGEFGERVAFAVASKKLHGLTTDRTEFFGRMGSRASPAALGRIGLASAVEAGLDPCVALMLHLDLQPGEAEEVYFILGEGAGREEALDLVRRFKRPEEVAAAWQGTNQFWDELLGTVQIQTPDPALDLLLNRWLLYQTLSCRIWGRSALYQSSGAYGFRDQLQDVMATSFGNPQLARAQILRAARHQFEAGDVLHWWHPPSGRGVRTRFSDDLLWLPFVTAHYVGTSGDTTILDEKVPFLVGPPLEEGQEESYGQFEATEQEYTLYEHCRRALEKGTTSGPHGLPLMKSGDWNDGMNRVGAEGRGESIWLAWFLIDTLRRFAGLAVDHGETSQAANYQATADRILQAVEAQGWDGNWYLRAFYDDGTPLGSASNRECKIDSIAQSWGVLSQAANPDRARLAMQAVTEHLVRPQDKLILLFTPPFDKTLRDPGYIKGYLPGIRENGGQYTHAALWSVWAFAELGQGDYAAGLFSLLNPVLHADNQKKAAHYKVEPYVVAADIYGVPPHTGRGGWTWYTGSAGWMYRLGVEAMLGLRRAGEFILISPCIPKGWPVYQLQVILDMTSYHIRVENPQGVNRGVKTVELDGKMLPDGKVPLLKDKKAHEVRVILG